MNIEAHDWAFPLTIIGSILFLFLYYNFIWLNWFAGLISAEGIGIVVAYVLVFFLVLIGQILLIFGCMMLMAIGFAISDY